MAESLGIIVTSSPMDGLIVGDYPLRDKAITVKNGSGALARGTVMGKITKEVGSVVPGGSNTGNGTVSSIVMGKLAKLGNYVLTCINSAKSGRTAPATGTPGTNTGNGTMTGVTAGAEAKAGSYKMTCIAESTNGGKFKVIAPDGNRLDDADVDSAYSSSQINFTINDGSTDFAVGDTFTVAVGNGGVFEVKDPDGYKLPDAEVGVAYSNPQINFTIGDGSTDWEEGDTLTIPINTPSSELCVKSLAAAVDGSQEIDCVLTEAVDATSQAVLKSGYTTGDFNENKLVFGTGHTANSLRTSARSKNIYFHNVPTVPTY